MTTPRLLTTLIMILIMVVMSFAFNPTPCDINKGSCGNEACTPEESCFPFFFQQIHPHIPRGYYCLETKIKCPTPKPKPNPDFNPNPCNPDKGSCGNEACTPEESCMYFFFQDIHPHIPRGFYCLEPLIKCPNPSISRSKWAITA